MSALPRPLVFVGGTGRSGTHVVADLLDHHPHYAEVPIESRFHTNPRGFPDLLAGRVTKEQFLEKLRRFWWYRIRAGEPFPAVLPRIPAGRQTRGLHKVVPRERFERAVEEFDLTFEEDPERACRELFEGLLRPIADEAGKPGLVEMSCFTIAQAPILAQLFPEALFIHTVRDGRDAGSSKVSKRQKPDHPTDPFEGMEWWLGRLAMIEEGVRGAPPERLLTVSLDQLVGGDREATYEAVIGFLEIDDDPGMRSFFENEMSAESAHRGRWRSELDRDGQKRLTALYEEALAMLEAEGYHCAAVLGDAYARLG